FLRLPAPSACRRSTCSLFPHAFGGSARLLRVVHDFSPRPAMSSPAYDEMRAADHGIRAHYRAFADWLDRTPNERVAQKREEAERLFHRVGITFAVYGEDTGTERLIPFDLVPR